MEAPSSIILRLLKRGLNCHDNQLQSCRHRNCTTIKMLLVFLIILILPEALCSEANNKPVRPYSFPIPFELPTRNDRSEQCWLRIEDLEITETVSVYCFIVHSFLRSHIRNYNSKKVAEDGVDVILWIEDPRIADEEVISKPPESINAIKDWRVTTILDPITRMRLYVTKNAQCKIILYSREAMTNYQVDCEQILYYINDKTTGNAILKRANNFVLVTSFFVVFLFIFIY